jgi:hypothetical protein
MKMLMKFRRAPCGRIMTLAALLALSACASEPDAAHPVTAMWRVGYVDHEVDLTESTPLVRFSQDCRSVLPDAQTDGAKWVMLHYRRPPEEVFRVVPLPRDQHVAAHQTVYVKVDDCSQAIEPRTP